MKFKDLINRTTDQAHKEKIPYILVNKVNKKWKISYNHNIFEKEELRKILLKHLNIKEKTAQPKVQKR